MGDLLLDRDALISECGKYRYWLSRVWDRRLPMATFIMLNPSTADASVDDPTIRKCMGFARSWGMGGIYVGNLFAIRATDPREMLKAADPVGPQNRLHLGSVCRVSGNGGKVICAWGASGAHMGQDQKFIRWCDSEWAVKTYALGVTKAGQPRHPLYVAYDTALREFA